MRNSYPFLYFLTLTLFKQQSKHLSALLISVVIISLIGAVLFTASSLQYTLQDTLKDQPDFILGRIQAGKTVNTPLALLDKIVELEGVTDVAPRVYGRYEYAPREASFLIVGVDFFDVQNSARLQKIIEDIDLKAFFSEPSMIVGEGVKNFLNAHYYTDTFSFKTPQGSFEKVKIYQTLPPSLNFFSNDMILMPIDLARKIFGMEEGEVTDIAFNVPNDAEWDNVTGKLYLLAYDIRVIDKKEVKKAYESLYNYQSGFFLILFIITLITFMLIVYQRYAMVNSTERKEIGILRALGWSIRDILKLKFYETLFIVTAAYIIGMALAYGYVFVLDAPILTQIFLGGSNLPNQVRFVPYIEFGILGSIFLLYAVPFFAAVLIPAWRIAVIPPKEAML